MPATQQWVARASAGIAAATGAAGFAYLLGAFGPVSCWESQSATGSSTAGGGGGSTGVEVTRGCTAGIDYLLSGAGGNAPVLFGWSWVLLTLVVVGGWATWTGRVRVLWGTVVVGAVVTFLGMFSIGYLFAAPTLLLGVAGVLLLIDDGDDEDSEGADAEAAAAD